MTNVDTDRDDTRATGHMGKSSSVAWAQRTAEECRRTSNKETGTGKHDADFALASYHTEDADLDFVDTSTVNPFEWPDPKLADTLVRSYFVHVHNTYPVVDKAGFMVKYTQFRPGATDLSPDEMTWLGILNIMFAISAVHAHLTRGTHRGHHQDHLIYCARAKFLCMDQGLLYQDPKVSTVAAIGLMGLYYMTTCRLNRYNDFLFSPAFLSD